MGLDGVHGRVRPYEPVEVAMDELLIGYVLGTLTPEEQVQMEAHLVAVPADRIRLESLRQLCQSLATDRPATPPPGLALATVSRVAQYVVAHRVPKTEPIEVVPIRRMTWSNEPVDLGGNWRRLELAIVAGIAFIAVGLGLAGITKLRTDAQTIACQDSLRELHTSLTSYSDTHQGRYPEVGSPSIPTAGAFVAELSRTGHLTPSPPTCPVIARVESGPPAGYSYALGYRDATGVVHGLRNDDGDNTPLAADLPSIVLASVTQTQTPHERGQNVLYIGGHVRFTSSPRAGVNGDHIYQNEAGQVRAGLHIRDTSLGRWADLP